MIFIVFSLVYYVKTLHATYYNTEFYVCLVAKNNFFCDKMEITWNFVGFYNSNELSFNKKS